MPADEASAQLFGGGVDDGEDWLPAWERAFIALRRAMRSSRIAST